MLLVKLRRSNISLALDFYTMLSVDVSAAVIPKFEYEPYDL